MGAEDGEGSDRGRRIEGQEERQRMRKRQRKEGKYRRSNTEKGQVG